MKIDIQGNSAQRHHCHRSKSKVITCQIQMMKGKSHFNYRLARWIGN